MSLDALREELGRRVRGEVRFDDGSRALYATDASNYRQVPIGVIVPLDEADVVATVAVCRAHGVPLLGRGGGTSLAGQCCNEAVVIDTSKHLRHVLAIDPERRVARVEPGLVLDDLQREAHRHGLMFGPDPATHNRCTLGGMIGNNSCGVRSVLAGRTADNVESLEILTYRGARFTVGRVDEAELARIIAQGGERGRIHAELRALRDRYAALVRQRFPDIPRRVSGYGLDQLLPENGFHVARALVGSEGTCVLVLSAEVRLVHWPRFRALVVAGYPDVYAAADAVPEVMRSRPIGLEGLDDRLVSDARARHLNEDGLNLLPSGGGWLVVEFGGDTPEEARAGAEALRSALAGKAGAPSLAVFDDPHQQHLIWKVREAGLAATAIVPGKTRTWEGWEDAAVPPERLGSYLRRLRGLFDRYGYRGDFYGHFGQGCVHTRIDFDLASAPGIAKYRSFVEEAADLVVEHGGSLSGEHGDGQSRAELLPRMFGPELVAAFEEFKRIWDPDWKMNPGKVVRPYRLDENLRLGATYAPHDPETRLRFDEEDGHRFAAVGLRCVGVGECRKTEGGTMCPSYRATLEEKHSTRGRAHLLFEMLNGQVLRDLWQDEHVKEALDLCLACKACKSECPVGVDMASYKAEFLSHYYEGHHRPRQAYAFGWIDRWARLASIAPRLVNALSHAPGLASIAKAVAGIAPERTIPSFAPQTFTSRFRRRRAARTDGPPVLLFTDTFNDHFHPDTLDAACRVLEAAGHTVRLPAERVCCGRPLYDYGMLDTARRYLARTIDVLRPEIAAGTPILVLEPSCASVFRDELARQFTDDAARRLSQQVTTLGELLQREPARLSSLHLDGRVLLHQHCHQKAVLQSAPDAAVLRALGLDVQVLDAGCCGMAGAFGFEPKHYDVSMKIGEAVLLPAVRAAAPETLIVTDGFSCREQIAQGTARCAVPLAEVVARSLPSPF